MILVIMEPEMKDGNRWSGPLALELGGTLCKDLDPPFTRTLISYSLAESVAPLSS